MEAAGASVGAGSSRIGAHATAPRVTMAPLSGSDPFPILSGLPSPGALHQMSERQLEALAAEMRTAIIETVACTGGHLGASLGTVELTIALHSELESPRDKILWDVGHQAYGHKLLTGRLDRFGTLRQHGGLSGFLSRGESEHDVMGAGHASTAISYATGLAEAQRLAGRDHGHVVCVVGDGALTGGMAYEGLNQAGALGSPITVVLNDNGMSISQNVGAFHQMLQRARLDPTLTKVRGELEKGLAMIPGVREVGSALKDATKALFVPGMLFEALGFAYLGPVDGHDIAAVRAALRTALEQDRPMIVHCHTVKGRGYAPAEADGEAMHGATPFVVTSGKAAKPASGPAGLHGGLRPRAGGRGRARPARGRHHGGDAEGHGHLPPGRPLPRPGLRRRHRRAARRGLRLRPRPRRLPAGLRHLLDVPAAGVRPDHPRRRPPGPAGHLRDRPRRPGRATTARPTTAPSTWPTCAPSRGSPSWPRWTRPSWSTCSTPPCAPTAPWPSATRAGPARGPSRTHRRGSWRSGGPRCSSAASAWR